ncbi:AraC family transcriptional regulator [Paenibacillus sp. GYB003]|uniref:AraC family transcriptional regulator n=1 Tax=Paenibacillus sp. GYB003 TaxID=2994392 RepID=UPI002F96A6A1
MLIFEHCPYLDLDRDPISLDICNANKRFKPLFHFHPGIEMIYVHSGTGSVIIEQSIHDVKPGTLLFVKPYQPHYLQMQVSPSQPYVRSLIKYDPAYFSEYLKAFPSLREFHDYLCGDAANAPVQHFPNRELETFLSENYDRLRRHPFRNRMEGHALFLVSLFHYLYPLWKRESPTDTPKPRDVPAVVRIMSWINDHFDEEFQLEALAQAVHLSPNHVSGLFRKATGKTITEFLTDRRLKQACILLKTTTSSVQEIGEKSGWPNFNYFCSVFKKRTGMTPKQYRNI